MSAEEVTLLCDFNNLQGPTCRNGTIEPQTVFRPVANRNSHPKFTN
jgi:hypothetical protein